MGKINISVVVFFMRKHPYQKQDFLKLKRLRFHMYYFKNYLNMRTLSIVREFNTQNHWASDRLYRDPLEL